MRKHLPWIVITALLTVLISWSAYEDMKADEYLKQQGCIDWSEYRESSARDIPDEVKNWPEGKYQCPDGSIVWKPRV